MSQRTLRALRERWDRRAQQNAMYYIHAEREHWTVAEFLASGEADICRLADPLLPLLSTPASQATALEIGCGLGRLARPLARRFRQVEAIDISPQMIERARRFAPPLPANLRFQVCDGSGVIPLAADTVDFVFSYIVLQHVPAMAIIATYLSEIARVLLPGGLAHIQLNTLRRPFKERLSIGMVASDKVPLLRCRPKITLRPHSTMGVVLDIPACERMASQSQLWLEQVSGAGSQYTWLTLRKPL